MGFALLGFALALLGGLTGGVMMIILLAFGIGMGFVVSLFFGAPLFVTLIHLGITLLAYNLGLIGWIVWHAVGLPRVRRSLPQVTSS